MPTNMGPGNALVEKTYRPGVILEAEMATNVMKLSGPEAEKSNYAFQIVDRPGNGRGDNIEIRFATINDSEWPTSSKVDPLGQESSTRYLTDSVSMLYQKLTGGVDNVMEGQEEVSFDLVDGENSRIALQWGYVFENWVMNQITGNTVANTTAADYAACGCQAVTAMDANHTYYCGSGNTTDALVAADANAVPTTQTINDLVYKATTKKFVKWPLVPAKTPFGDLYIFLVDGYGYKSIRENGTESDFYDLAKAEIQGGLDIMTSPLITGEGFIYDKTLVLKTNFAPKGITSSAAQDNTRVASFLGARAGHWMFGSQYTNGNHLGYSTFTVHRRLSIVVDTIAGFKRTIVDGESYGAWRVVHYADK